MSWAVGWDGELRRFRGYGVPAYCDAKGCAKVIDRGLGWLAQPDPPNDLDDEERDFWFDEYDDLADGAYFTCSDHRHRDVDPDDLPPEHQEWVAHISDDDSWAKWRSENPDLLAYWQAT